MDVLKKSDFVRYLGDGGGAFSFNRVYEVIIVDGPKNAYIEDDDGITRAISRNLENDDYFVKVSDELAEEPQPDVHALLANLARRLSEVEAAQERASFEAIVDDFEEAVADLSGEGSDVVNSPAHYKLGKFETIEVIEEITKGYDDGFVAHCAGTAIKYIARAPHKHDTPLEDLRKAARYLDYAIERLQAEASE